MEARNSFNRRRIPALLACVLLVAAFAPWPALHAAQITVCATGCDYSNIQSAIDSAKNGDLIKIKNGIFPEKLTITNKRLKLTGEGARHTIIDGTSVDDGRHVMELKCQASSDILIADLTITGGLPSSADGRGGGGIDNGCRLTLEGVIVTNNATREGGGIINSGYMEVHNSVISDNSAFDLSGGGIENSGDMFISRSTIINNSARIGGGGIANSGTLVLENSLVSNNNARLGGGIAVTVGSKEASLREVSITNNSATQRGGGVWNGAQLEIKGSLIIGNEASGNLSDRRGGGVFNATPGILEIKNTIVLRNRADDSGGGIYNDGGTVSVLGASTISYNKPNDTCCP